jgi:hypothetical protein
MPCSAECFQDKGLLQDQDLKRQFLEYVNETLEHLEQLAQPQPAGKSVCQSWEARTTVG